MASRLSIQRLKDKYGDTGITGKKYQSLMAEIIQKNSESIARNMAKISNKTWRDEAKKIIDRDSKRSITLTFPTIDEVLPGRRAYIKKGAEKGQIINATLRTKLTQDLRNALTGFEEEGKYKGRLKPEIIKKFRENITDTFRSYRDRDGKYGEPANLRNIAVTEVRSTVNEIRQNYVEQFQEKNKDTIELQKEWIQNKSMAKDPRGNHKALHRTRKGLDESFEIQEMQGKKYTGRTLKAKRPHDPDLPLNEIIGCNCELKYIAKVKK